MWQGDLPDAFKSDFWCLPGLCVLHDVYLCALLILVSLPCCYSELKYI